MKVRYKTICLVLLPIIPILVFAPFLYSLLWTTTHARVIEINQMKFNIPIFWVLKPGDWEQANETSIIKFSKTILFTSESSEITFVKATKASPLIDNLEQWKIKTLEINKASGYQNINNPKFNVYNNCLFNYVPMGKKQEIHAECIYKGMVLHYYGTETNLTDYLHLIE